MSVVFRPQSINRQDRLRHRREGYASWPAFQYRYSPDDAFSRAFRRLHYLARHAPARVQDRWKPAYQRFTDRVVAKNASGRYANTWSAEARL
jgi:hypothetical protein